MVQAILWDFGGVLTTSPFDNFTRFERENGLPENFLRGINAVNPDTNAWARFERNEADLDEFDRLFEEETRAAGHPVPGAKIVPLLATDLRPAMVEALRRCAARMPVGCITNNAKAGKGPSMSRSPEKAQAVAEVMTLFSVVVESSKVGLRKPDPRIYQMACDMLQIAPGDAAYLDDLGINLKPARALGMTTIKVSEPDQAITDLEGVVGIPLR